VTFIGLPHPVSPSAITGTFTCRTTFWIFFAHLLTCYVSCVWESISRGNGITGKKDHGKVRSFDESGGEPVVGTAVGEDLLGIVVRFNRRGAEAGGLDGWDAAADIRRRELRLGYLAWLASLPRDGRFELERVLYRVDD
jgi:hypothetical protein